MKAYTHILGGLAAATIAIVLHVPHPDCVVLSSAAGSLIPDWDHPKSVLGRFLPWPAAYASRGPRVPPRVGRIGWPHPIWHRHQAHSVAGIIISSAIALFLASSVATLAHWRLPTPFWIGFGLFLGSASHLVLDGFNDERQWWGWPISRRGFRWPWHLGVRYTDHAASLALTVLLVFTVWHFRADFSVLWPPR